MGRDAPGPARVRTGKAREDLIDMVSAEQPLTRRALRSAQSRTIAPLPRVRRHTLRLSFEAVAAATAVAFLGGAVAGVAIDTADRQALATLTAAQARQERVDRAATVRLTAAAARYAVVRQEQALAAAQAALSDAEAVLRTAPTLVGDTTVDPLDDAVSRLAALVVSADRTIVPTLRTDAAVSVVTDTDPTDRGPADTEPPASEITGLTPPSAAFPTPGTSAPGAASDAPAGRGSTVAAAGAEATALALVGVSDDVLDLATSAELLAAAQQVAALSAQVTALSDAVAVELADAEEATAARLAEQEAKRIAAEQAALQAALARMSTRIAATDAAPNGEIPVELLCRPRFANVLLRCDAAAALEQVNTAYRAAFGRDLAVSGGYRTLAEQQQARATKGDLAAEPGTSNHGRALAVDFSDFGSVGQFDDPDYLWMVANAPQFGWVHPPGMGPGGSGPLEPWHWEFGDI